MRLDKYICDVTEYSRNEIKQMARKKRITVNGQVITDSGYQVDGSEEIFVDDKQIIREEFEYYLLNKPAGYISATYDPNYPVVMELINSFRKDLAVVGRLDKDTEGALMITNDGQLNHQLLSANYHVSKKYYAVTEAIIPENAAEVFSKPIKFEDFTSLPGEYEPIDQHSGYLTITEGKFHQVKRMFEHIGCPLTYLRRDMFAFLTTEGLKLGEYRKLTTEEVEQLKKLVEKKK